MKFSKFISTAKKILVCTFIALHSFLIIEDSLPDPSTLMLRIMRILDPYQNLIGFHQGWSMFAPHPGGLNSYLDAIVDYTDGTQARWHFPRPSRMSFLDKSLVGEKFRKMGQERLLPSENMALWNDLSRYVLRNMKRENKEIYQVQFYRHTSQVKSPDKLFIYHGTTSTPYKVQSTFNYKQPQSYSYAN